MSRKQRRSPLKTVELTRDEIWALLKHLPGARAIDISDDRDLRTAWVKLSAQVTDNA